MTGGTVSGTVPSGRPRLRLEARDQPGLLTHLAVSLLLLVAALFLAGIVMTVAGGNPLDVYRSMFGAGFGSKWGLNDTLVKMVPLTLASLGVALAFRMKMWNIGAEGQLLMGALAASGVALFAVPPDMPQWLALALLAAAGAAGGAVWGIVPGWLRAQFGVNEIISTLMLNYVALSIVQFFVYGPWGERGFGLTPMFERNTWLPRLTEYADQWSALRGLTLHLGILAVPVAIVFLAILLNRTKFGFEIAMVGDNPDAARYAGVRLRRTMIIVMALSGALAGLAGMNEVSGVVHRLLEHISPGYGYTAIIVAWLGRFNPLAVAVVAFLFGGLIVGADEIQSAGISSLLQGVILFVMVSGNLLIRYRIRLRVPETLA